MRECRGGYTCSPIRIDEPVRRPPAHPVHRVVVRLGSGAEDPRLLLLELRPGEHALILQLAELLELCELVRHAVLRRTLVGLRVLPVLLLLVVLLLVVLLLVLTGPTPGLPARDTVGHGRGRAGDDSGAGDSPK